LFAKHSIEPRVDLCLFLNEGVIKPKTNERSIAESGVHRGEAAKIKMAFDLFETFLPRCGAIKQNKKMDKIKVKV
jgi:hypothetical protein